ncbi:CLE family OsCLE701 protein, partial [Zea mays]
MSRPAWSAREALAASAVAAVLLGGLVLMSLVVGRDARTPSPASAAAPAVGGRRMVIGATEELKGGDDPLSSSKRRVPNGPDPIHNR